jgi:uncharacterized protein (TIGR03382 family)
MRPFALLALSLCATPAYAEPVPCDPAILGSNAYASFPPDGTTGLPANLLAAFVRLPDAGCTYDGTFGSDPFGPFPDVPADGWLRRNLDETTLNPPPGHSYTMVYRPLMPPGVRSESWSTTLHLADEPTYGVRVTRADIQTPTWEPDGGTSTFQVRASWPEIAGTANGYLVVTSPQDTRSKEAIVLPDENGDFVWESEHTLPRGGRACADVRVYLNVDPESEHDATVRVETHCIERPLCATSGSAASWAWIALTALLMFRRRPSPTSPRLPCAP